MDKLKQALLASEEKSKETVTDKVEVIGMTIASCLNRACDYLKTDLSMIDYEIIERGKKSFLNARPFRLLVSLLHDQSPYSELEEFSMMLGVGDRMLSSDLDRFVEPKHRDGSVSVRIYRSGVQLLVQPPLGDGKAADLEQALHRLNQSGIRSFDSSKVEQAVRNPEGKPARIADYVPKPEADSSCKIEITPDETKAFVRITAPRPGGRHLEVNDVVGALRAHNVVVGFIEENIKRALDEDRYMEEVLAAQGTPPDHGKDAYIDFKVDVQKDRMQFEEDSSGRVDFKKMNLVENVVVGQILAEKIPSTVGRPGKTLFNRYIEARDGKDIELKPGKGTILSEDGNKLIAEINGQVVFSNNKLAVEPVYKVAGDVGPKTGNIMFLGSVVITGSVLDNYEVKAAGNIEIHGTVQKAKIEAEGDIIVTSGIVGREEARIESTGGSLFAKFIQSAEINVAKDVICQEGILHSRVEAGESIICNGRRAQIVGGNIRATREVRARIIGSQAYTATEVVVGTDPRILSQYEEYRKMEGETNDKLSTTRKSLATLEARKKADPDGFTEEQEQLLKKNEQQIKRMEHRLGELKEEIARLEEFMNQISAEGKVHAEKEVHPGVNITIRGDTHQVSDTYQSVSFRFDKGFVVAGKLEKAEEQVGRGRGRRR